MYNGQSHDHNIANTDLGATQRVHEHRAFTQDAGNFGGNFESHRPPTYFINFIVKAR
jgi:hypothetical protein